MGERRKLLARRESGTGSKEKRSRGASAMAPQVMYQGPHLTTMIKEMAIPRIRTHDFMVR